MIADFIAQLTYKTTEEGGRRTPAFSNYRPAIKFPFDSMQTSGEQKFIDKKEVFPGEAVKAEIKIHAVAYFESKLSKGDTFDFREGPRIIGTGKILEIINETLLKK